MKFITISGIDKSGKTTIIKELMDKTFYKHYVVDRDPSNYHSLCILQKRHKTISQKEEYKTFTKRFSKIVDLAVLLKCNETTLKERFIKTNEPKLVGFCTIKEHQLLIEQKFDAIGYKNYIKIDTSNKTVSHCVNLIISKLGEL